MKVDNERRMTRFRNQRWLLDNIIRTVGIDWDQGRTSRLLSNIGMTANGDVTQVRSRITKFKDIPREFEKIARRREEMARQAEERASRVTARNNYFMAALYYINAQWPIFEDDNALKLSLGEKQNRCYDKYIEYADHRIERVEIPFQDTSVPAVLHFPKVPISPSPCVLCIPGMDSVKEEMSLYGDPFLERGMATLRLDGPGQGESNLRKIRATENNYAEAGRKAVDYLLTRKDIDPARLGLYGVSMGSYWGFRTAAAEDRFKAVALSGTCLEPGMDSIFNAASPTFKLNYMYMTGYDDEDAFDVFAEKLDVRGLEANLKAPFLLVAGEDDELCPIEWTHAIFDNVPDPKKLVVYEGERHSIRNPHYRDTVADWLKDRLEDKPMGSEKVYVEASGRESVEQIGSG